MAILYKATISPTKPELLARILGEPVDILGTYRFDDPAGEVGVEGFLVRVADATRHTVLTYRDAPLADAEAFLVDTTEHSTLGRRWVYDGQGDPVALACFERALAGQQEQAVLEVWDAGQLVQTREPTARVDLKPGTTSPALTPVIVSDPATPAPANAAVLGVSWDGGSGIIAYRA